MGYWTVGKKFQEQHSAGKMEFQPLKSHSRGILDPRLSDESPKKDHALGIKVIPWVKGEN